MNQLRNCFVAVLALAAACSGGGSTGPGGNPGTGGTGGTGNPSCPGGAVCMLSSSFQPTSLNVTVNSTVRFINDSGILHDVNFTGTRAPGVGDIPTHSSGTNERIFTTTGTFPFHCNQHAGMNGQIVVN